MAVVQNLASTAGIRPVPGWKKTLEVTAWELRHFGASRSGWALGAAAFGFFVVLLGVRNQWGYVLGTTAMGQMAELVYDLMLVFGVVLPFLVTDRVAHDYQERMHELLMATAVPTRIYVLGRYLAALFVSLGLAITLLAAQLLVNLALPAMDARYPPANPITTFSLWARLTLPAGLLVGSLSFCLGTLFPRLTAIPKLAISIAWIILALDNDPTDLTWRAYWNPSGAGMITLVYQHFQDLAESGLKTALGPAQQAELILRLQQSLPDLRPWLGPFLALAGIGLLLGLLAIASFQRFRSSMNA
jgi:hypothetical protein